MSLVEALTNVGVGYVLGVLTQLIVLPLFGVRIGLSDNLLIGAVFTVVSLTRGYLLRRLFETIRIRGRNDRVGGTTTVVPRRRCRA